MPPKIPRKCLTRKAPKCKLPRFQLLGESDCENPSAISKEQILAWQEQGIIEYLGSTKDVRPFLESSSCVVLPSFYKEGVPRVLLEAMSMGKPIITTNITGCRECVAPPFTPYKNLLIGQNGILTPPKDINALALAISLLTSNTFSPLSPATLTQMGAKARAFVKGRFDVARIMECYKRAVRENSASGNHSRVSFLAKNGDCCGEPAVITTQGNSLDSPCKAPFLSQKSCREQTHLESNITKDSATAQNLNESIKDSRICDEKSGLCERVQGRILGVCNRSAREAIADLSRKAESTSQKPNLVFVSNTCFAMLNFRLQVLKSLQKSGFAIHIIAPFDSSTSSLEQEGFITHNLYLDSRSLNPLKDFRTITTLHKLLKQIRPALVFNYTIKPAIYSSSVCNFLKIPNIALITGLGYVFINDKGKTSSLKKRVLRSIVCKMYRFALSKTQEVWFLNNDDKQEFLFYKLIKQNQAFLLDSEGVDTEYFSPKSSDVKAEKQGEQEQVEQKEIVFLLVARMLWDKGVGEFVEAAKMVQDSIKEANRVESNGGGHNKTFT